MKCLYMAKKSKRYTEEFNGTIIELYNSGKSLSELSSEYGIAKSTIKCSHQKASILQSSHTNEL